MGNKPVSGNKGAAAGSAPVDSDEYWWAELEKNLRPIKSCEEFCERFNVKPEQYETSKKQFLDMIADGPEKDRDKPYVTREAWLACVPDTDASKKWVLNIWKCFDADRNNQLTLDEWLVFDGIRKYGSLEQRVMGSFIMYDHSEDHKIQREEVVAMMRTATAVAGAQLTDAMIQQALETLMAIADTDHSGTLELHEIMSAARANPAVAKIFNSV